MRIAAATLLATAFICLAALAPRADLSAQEKAKLVVTDKAVDKKEKDESQAPKKNAPEDKFDQKKADVEMLKAAGLAFEAEPLLDFFRKHTVTDESLAKLGGLIKQLGDDDFDTRETASDEIEKYGVAAIGLLRQAERGGNPEVIRRCERALKSIEKVPTRSLAAAAARLLGDLKPEGASETLLNYLPLSEDDSTSEEVRNTLALLAMKDGKPDPVLEKALDSKEPLKRGAAAEAFARGGDKAMREQMQNLLAKDPDSEVKLRIAVALVTAGKSKAAVDEMIRLMAEVPPDAGWRAEDVLVRLAGEKGPSVSLGADKASREKARDEWQKWWKANEKDVELARLDDTERTLGYTLLVEMDIRGVGGRVKEVTPDGKIRWEVSNVQFPTDAIVVGNNRVVIAEQNTNRVSERDTTNGREVWGENFNQPIGLSKLPNGNLLIVGRHQVVEWDRARKPVSTITRPQHDIIAGAKLRNGNVCVYTTAGHIVTYDKTGKQVDSFTIGRGNYNSTMQVLPNGKLVVTQLRSIAEVDLTAKKADQLMPCNFSPTSAQKLPNGNVLLSNQNNYQVSEMDPKTNKAVWDYKPDNNNNNFYRAWRAKRR